MSRGPGRIERAIEALFRGHPDDDAFTVEDIALDRGSCIAIRGAHHETIARAA